MIQTMLCDELCVAGRLGANDDDGRSESGGWSSGCLAMPKLILTADGSRSVCKHKVVKQFTLAAASLVAQHCNSCPCTAVYLAPWCDTGNCESRNENKMRSAPEIRYKVCHNEHPCAHCEGVHSYR